MPSTEPKRPIDQADASRLAEVRLRFQKLYSERMTKRIAQLEEQREQMKLEINRLRQIVEATSIRSSRRYSRRRARQDDLSPPMVLRTEEP